MDKETKAFLEILIKEIYDVLPDELPLAKFNWETHINMGRKEIIDKIKSVIEPWIKANDLHPELVQTLKREK